MELPIYQVDAFTNQPFRGNPAAVCLLQQPASDTWMQVVAREMNLSETAFLVPIEDGFNLRWFTPTVEVALCGHATLASAHVLWETGYLGENQFARFHTLSGLLTAKKLGDWIEMDFPTRPESGVESPEGLEQALGATALYTGKNEYDYLVLVEDEMIVRNLKPDFTALGRLPVRGVIVTSHSSSPDFDFVSRFFAPGAGVNEDPVTGSAHCCLGPFWQERLGKDTFTAYQASPRGGVVKVRVFGERTLLSGQAITILQGTLWS